jgi:chemotaxis response regulator CheB
MFHHYFRFSLTTFEMNPAAGDFQIVGMAASAGGLNALTQVLTALPADRRDRDAAQQARRAACAEGRDARRRAVVSRRRAKRDAAGR